MMHGPDGVDYPNGYVYKEVAAPDRLAYTTGRSARPSRSMTSWG